MATHPRANPDSTASARPNSPKQRVALNGNQLPTAPVETAPLPTFLDEVVFRNAVAELSNRDLDLARVLETYGPPPFWTREPGFPSLLYIILEQQVSLASARALYNKLEQAVRPLTPAGFLKLTETQMRALGFSRQ